MTQSHNVKLKRNFCHFTWQPTNEMMIEGKHQVSRRPTNENHSRFTSNYKGKIFIAKHTGTIPTGMVPEWTIPADYGRNIPEPFQKLKLLRDKKACWNL